MERLGKASGRLNAGAQSWFAALRGWEAVRWPRAVNLTELSSSDWRAQQSQASEFSHYHLLAARSEMRGSHGTQGDVGLRIQSTADRGGIPFGP